MGGGGGEANIFYLPKCSLTVSRFFSFSMAYEYIQHIQSLQLFLQSSSILLHIGGPLGPPVVEYSFPKLDLNC